MKPGVQIISVSTVHNLERATHLTITTVRASDQGEPHGTMTHNNQKPL